MSTEAIIPVGSDNREHHPRGFSFLGALDACPGACRTTSAPKNLADAGDRGTELHAVMEQSVKQWMTEFEAGGTRLFEEVVEQHLVGLPLSDQKSIRRIVEEIKNFFVVTESLTIGVEERIDLLDPETGFVLSFGYYDVLLILGPNCLIIDYKFVRGRSTKRKRTDRATRWRSPSGRPTRTSRTLPFCSHCPTARQPAIPSAGSSIRRVLKLSSSRSSTGQTSPTRCFTPASSATIASIVAAARPRCSRFRPWRRRSCR
jgi:hypothetical protein